MRLKIEGIEFSYNSVPVLRGVSFEVEPGQVVSILGTNGAGKTTLLRTINRVLRPCRGKVYLGQQDLERMSRREVARRMGYVPQFSPRAPVRVFEAVLLGRRPYMGWAPSHMDIQIAEEVLDLLDLAHLAMRRIDELSGGEFQKVILARALAQQPRVLLMDEPTSNLDLKNQLEVMEIIRKATLSRELNTLVVMHDVNLALRFSHRFVLLKNGLIAGAGGEEILTPQTIREIYGVEARVEKIDGVKVVIPLRPEP